MTADGPNREQVEYWNSVAGAKWVEFQERLDAQLGPLGETAADRLGLTASERVLDVGCGCGAQTLAVARRVGPGGLVTGVDVSQPMLERARSRAAAAGLSQVTFLAADAQTRRFEPCSFDAVFSRFGVMFFTDFAAAFANLRAALVPGGRLAFVAWQPLERNAWMHVPLRVAASLVDLPPPLPPGSPGPFGLDDAGRIRDALGAAGFDGVSIDAIDAPQNVGGARTLDEAVDFLMHAGPAAAALKGAPRELRARLVEALAGALAAYVTPGGVVLPGAAWIVTASSPPLLRARPGVG